MIEMLPLATYTLVMSITPGPNNVMVTASAANFGFRRTLPHMLGIVGGFTLLVAVVCLGLGAVFLRWPALQLVLAWLGAAYLLWMGWKLVGAGAVGSAGSARPLRLHEAALFQWVNPKAWVFAVTAASLFVPATGLQVPALALIVVVIGAVCLPCVAVWALFGSGLRRFLGSPARRRGFNLVMALALAGTAAVMLVPRP